LSEDRANNCLRSFVRIERNSERGLKRFIAPTGGDELMAPSATYDHSARLRSYAILADIFNYKEAPRAGESLTAARR
jgi:hypothetical protein